MAMAILYGKRDISTYQIIVSFRLCLNSQDPYCGWDTYKNVCNTAPASFPAHHWHQNINGCPVLEHSGRVCTPISLNVKLQVIIRLARETIFSGLSRLLDLGTRSTLRTPCQL